MSLNVHQEVDIPTQQPIGLWESNMNQKPCKNDSLSTRIVFDS